MAAALLLRRNVSRSAYGVAASNARQLSSRFAAMAATWHLAIKPANAMPMYSYHDLHRRNVKPMTQPSLVCLQL